MPSSIKQVLAFHIPYTQESPTPSLEWMPSGGHKIRASVSGKPKEIEVAVNEPLVNELNAQLSKRLQLAEAGQASRPFIDFNHKGEEAAAIPKRFFWENGIRLEVDWTQAGQAALAGRNYSYFSPEFLIDSSSGAIRGIPEVGPIGALVNTPAFQSIERLAAQHNPQDNSNDTPKDKTMEPIMTLLVAAGLASSLDPEKVDVQTLKQRLEDLQKSAKDLSQVQAQLASITQERDTLQEQAQANLQSAAAVSVEAAITAGKIKKEAKDHWVQAFLADPERTQAMITDLPEAPSAPPKPPGRAPVKAGHAGGATGDPKNPNTQAVRASDAWGQQFSGFRNN